MTACRINYVKMPSNNRRSTGKKRSRIMSNLHKKTYKKKSSARGRKHSSGRGRKHSNRRGRKHSRGRGRKHSRKHKRKHYVHHHRKHSNIGKGPVLNGFNVRDIVLGDIPPSQEILTHIPEIEILHKLLKKFKRGSKHGFNMPKRKEIYLKLLPKATHSDEQTHIAQKESISSIIKELEAMGLKTPSPPRPLTEREKDKLYNYETDRMMGLGGII